jgi:hypothetical protein
MSESATFYRISKETFDKLKLSDNPPMFDISLAKNYITFQGSFMGLEYLLKKGQNDQTKELISEIFTPNDTLGGDDFENLTPEELFEFYESESLIPYLDNYKVVEINRFLNQITEADLQINYNSDELNENGIYPQVWHNDNAPDKVFNLRHLLDDLEELKTIFNQASTDQDYLFVFVG